MGRVDSRADMYKGKTTSAVVFVAIVAASGGLLFGFDNGALVALRARIALGAAARRLLHLVLNPSPLALLRLVLNPSPLDITPSSFTNAPHLQVLLVA